MAKTIQGFISAKTGLVPAFKEIADLPEGQDGILRIETADLEGELALSKSRYITGAYVQTSGAKGVDALKVLLSARKGSFRYAHVEDGFSAELQQRIRLDIRKLVAESAEGDEAEPSRNEPPIPSRTTPATSASSSSDAKAVAAKSETPAAKDRTSSTRIELSGQRVYADNFDDDDEDDYNSLSSFSRSARAPIGESLFATEDPADADDDEWLKRLAKPKAKEKEEREAKALAEKQAAEKEAKERAEKQAKALAEKQAAEKEAKERAEKQAKALAEKQAAEKEAKERAEKQAKALAEKQAAEKEAKERAEKQAAEEEEEEEEAKAQAAKEAKALADKEEVEREAKAVEKEAAEREARVVAEKEAGEDADKDKANKDAARTEAKSRVEKFKEAAETDSAFDQRETASLKNLTSLPVKPVQSQLAAKAEQRRAESKLRPKTEVDYDFGKVDISKLPASKSSTNLEAAKPKADESLTRVDGPKDSAPIPAEKEKAPEKKSQWSVPSHFENVHAAGTHSGALEGQTVEKAAGEEDFSDIDAEIERDLATASGDATGVEAETNSDAETTSVADSKPDTREQSAGDKTSGTLTPVSSISQNKMSALGQLRADATKASEQKGAVPNQLKRPLPSADKNKPDISELDAIKTPNPKKLAETASDATASDEVAGDENESWVAKVVSSAKKEKVRESQMRMTAMAPIVPEAPRKKPITPSVRRKIQDDYSRTSSLKKEPKTKTKFLASRNNRIGAAVVAVGVAVGALAVGRTLIAESYSQKAAKLLTLKDYKQALSEVNTALTIDGGLKVAHFNRGQIEAKLNNDSVALEEFNSILKDDPNHIGALEHRAEIYVKQGQYQQALADCNKLMQLEGSSPSLSLISNRASANLMLGNNLDALSNFSMALQQSNKDPQLLIGRGMAYNNLKQFDKAIKDLDKAIKLNPKNAAAYVARAKTYLTQKNFDLAFADFNHALALAPGDAAVLTQRGASLGDAGQFEQALNSFSQAIQVNKKYAEAYKQRARILTLQHKYPEALADVAQLGKISGLDADYYRQRGDILSLQGADAKALESYTSSITKSPTSASLQSRASLYAKKNDLKLALADIATALNLDSTDSNLYVQKAIYEDKLGDSISANSDFTKAITLYPLNLKAHIARGQFLLKQQESSSAEEAFDTALKIDPKSAEAKQGKATARTLFAHLHPKSAAPALELAPSDRIDPQDEKLITSGTFTELISAGYKQLSKGNNERATALLAKAVRLNPNEANARRYLAHALMANGDTENAIAMLKAIVAINPDNTADSIALGEQLVKSGRVEDAIDTYSKTLTADKHNVKARCALARAYMSAGFKQKAKDVCEDGIKDSASPAETAALKATLSD